MQKPSQGMDAIAQQKSQHRDKLAQLLINKFRNRFGITSDNHHIEALIHSEVTNLLARGQATEQALIQLEQKIETLVQKMREEKHLNAEEKQLQMTFDMGPKSKTNEDAMSQRSHQSRISQKSLPFSQRSKASEKNSAIRSVGQAVTSSRDKGPMSSVRGKFEVLKENGAQKLNMTDEQWLQKVAESQAVGAREEMQKQEQKKRMLKEIQNEQIKQMQLKKDAEKKAKLEERQFFHDFGVKSSDVFYHNDDRVVEKRNSLRHQSKGVATHLNDQHQTKIQDKKQIMLEQAQKRQEELDNMKQEQEDGLAKRLEGKKQLYFSQLEDQGKKAQGKAHMKNFYNDKENFEQENMLSYFFRAGNTQGSAGLAGGVSGKI